MATNSWLIQLEGVEYTYPSALGGPPALKETHLSVGAGEVVRIVGRNGTGKTTLLKIIANKLTPTRGTRREKKGIRPIYLDQDASEFVGEALTVREQMVIGMGEEIGALESTSKRSLVEKVVSGVSRYGIGLEDKLDSFVAELSGGQQQIVALLSVLLARAELLVLDEFAAAMDPVSTKVSNALLQRAVRESGIGVVFVNHTFDGELVVDREVNLG